MNTHDKLVRYIRRGLRKGYSHQHLHDTLVRHGYDPKDVNKAMSHATGGPQREAARQRLKVLLGAVAIVAVILLAILILSYSNQQKEINTLNTQVQLTHEAAEAYLSELDRLQQEIDTQDTKVQESMQSLRAQGTPEARKAADEVQRLLTLIKEEREETKSILLDLLQAIVNRNPDQPMTQDPEWVITPKNSEEFLVYDDRRHTSK